MSCGKVTDEVPYFVVGKGNPSSTDTADTVEIYRFDQLALHLG